MEFIMNEENQKIAKENLENQNEKELIQNMWNDTVFVSRQQELQKLSKDFSSAIDQLIVNKPLVVKPDLIDMNYSSSYSDYSYDENEEEEEASYGEPRNINEIVKEQALLLMYEIDQMKKDTYQLISWFRPNLLKQNKRLLNMKNGLEFLVNFLDSLRIRCENLIG